MTQQNYDEAQFKIELLDFMDANRFMMVVSNGSDGWPMARTMGFVREGWNIWLTTVDGSLKARQIEHDHKITLLWREPTERFFKFLTLKGTAEISSDPSVISRVRELYQAKYKMTLTEASEQLKRIALRVKINYARAEGFGIAPPPIIRNFE